MADATAENLVALGRRVVAAGLVVASGGNLAARLPEPDHILVTPRGWALDELDAAALATVGLDGRHIFGPYAPTTELASCPPRPTNRDVARSTVSLNVPSSISCLRSM